MRIEDRKKLNANRIYITECVAIMFSKVRAEGYNFYDEDDMPLSSNIINMENYAGQTLTCAFNTQAMRVNLDGTNFSARFSSNDKGGFVYKVDELDLQYICNNRPLNDAINEKKVMRVVGKSSDYFRYLSCGTFYVLLESYSKKENGITKVRKTNIEDYNDEQLIAYMEEKMSKAEELDFDDDDEEISSNEVEAVQSLLDECDRLQEIYDNLPEGEIIENNEVDKYTSEGSYSNIYEIDFEVSDYIKYDLNYENYTCDLPEKVEEFDYQEYVRKLKTSEGEVIYPNVMEQIATLRTDYEEQDDEDDEVDYEESDGYEVAAETSIDEEGFADNSDYEVTIDNELVEDQRISEDIFDTAIGDVMDADQEVMTLVEYYNDIYSHIMSIRDIIIKRKELADKKLNKSEPEMELE